MTQTIPGITDKAVVFKNYAETKIPLKRIATPEEIAEMVSCKKWPVYY
jgi:hypothetical protein